LTADQDPVSGKFVAGNQAAKGHGRPKGSGVRQLLEKQAQEQAKSTPGLTREQAFVEILWDQALAGNEKTQELLLKRFWPERLALEHSGAIASDEEILEAQKRAGLIPEPDEAT